MQPTHTHPSNLFNAIIRNLSQFHSSELITIPFIRAPAMETMEKYKKEIEMKRKRRRKCQRTFVSMKLTIKNEEKVHINKFVFQFRFFFSSISTIPISCFAVSNDENSEEKKNAPEACVPKVKMVRYGQWRNFHYYIGVFSFFFGSTVCSGQPVETYTVSKSTERSITIVCVCVSHRCVYAPCALQSD